MLKKVHVAMMFFESCEMKIQSRKRFHVIELTAVSLIKITSSTIEFTNACGIEAAKNPCQYDSWRQAMYPHEKTKKLQTVPKNQSAPNIPWNKPHKPADTTALATIDSDVDNSPLSNPESISVSTIGANTTATMKLPKVASRTGAEWAATSTPTASASNIAKMDRRIERTKANGAKHKQYFQSAIEGASKKRSKYCMAFYPW